MSALTPHKIDSAKDDEIIWMVFEDIASKFTGFYHNRYEILSGMNLEQQMIYAVWVLEMEVRNGGFNQYFYNTEGRLKHISAAGYRKIGAVKLAELVSRANEIYVKQREKITEKQNGSLEGFSASYENNPLNDLDTEFYRLEEEEQLEKLMVEYIRKNKQKFV